MSVKPPDLLDGWDPLTQPRTTREFAAMVRHSLFVRNPALRPADLEWISEAVVLGMRRYGLGLRRSRWRLPPGARLDRQTLADLPVDELAFACGACSRVESHKRRHLMDRFGTYFPAAQVCGPLSRDCEQRRLHGHDFCRFTYAQNVRPLNERGIKWRVPSAAFRTRNRL